MSCNNWERGTVKLSVAEWAKFKKAFRDGFNKLQDAELTAATRHWEYYKSGKLPTWGKTPASRQAYCDFNQETVRFRCLWTHQRKMDCVVFNEARKRPRKPIRKDYPLATNKITEFCFDGEASISFDNKTREIHYYSGENNRAMESAREHSVGQLLYRLLSSVQWTRGTGGRFIGNDEYNQNQDGEGKGANYVTETWGYAKLSRKEILRNRCVI